MLQNRTGNPSRSVKTIAGIACAALLFAASAIHITSTAAKDPIVEASVNGTSIGYIQSGSDLTNAFLRLQRTVNTASNGEFVPDIDIDYSFTYVNDPVYITEDECYQYLWSQVEHNFCPAYVLYVDDVRAAAHENEDALDSLIGSIKSELIASLSEEYSDLRISSRIRIEKQLCLKDSLKTIDEINTLLNPLVGTEIAKVESDVIDTRVASIEVASPEIGSDTESILTLDYTLFSTVVRTETVPHETVYVDDYDYYVGTETVMNEGTDGIKAVTYEMIYDANGKFIAERAIEETVIKEPIKRIVHVGAKELPITAPTGSFIWPCHRPKGVSSYYGWRDLYGKADFHLGIDIPDSKGSMIWAADGGKVLFAGYTPSYGYNVHIEHSDGFSTLYAHLNSIFVEVGDEVYPGQQIGTMGATGVAYGTHLHFEVRIDNKTVDPMKYLPEE